MAKIDRAKTIYEAAIALPPERRTAFVEAQAGGDAELAAMVRDLIDATPSEGVTAIAPEPNASEDGTPAWPATARDGASEPVTLGPYRLLSKLGEGGFGVVWEAEQSAPVRRRVAVKIVKPGMDSASVVARFEAERQALAVMNHPCIAKVFDGGQTPDAQGARPYFVMELVRGDPITSFCDLNKLGLNERVDLMVRVCDAVQHAHTKGIIHRDLKPSNVLVQYQDGRPQPKVIDFGVAKAINQRLSEKTVFTDRGQMIGTPEYMSPEQAEMSGVDIDTRSDVYSLGVMLYELLTGALPFDSRSLRSAGFAEIQRIIREVEPPKPSTRLSGRSGEAPPERRGPINRDSATRTLRRDLDWVIMRCLEKSRDRRYETAKSLGEDLGRYLRHEPVQAGPPSVGYRTQKFLRRHRVGATLVSGVSLALVAGVIGTTWQWRQSERNRIEAERRLESIRGFSGDLLGALDRDLAGLPGGTGARRAAAEAAVQMLNELAEDEANASLIAIDLARAYRRASIIGAEGGAPLDQTVGRLREAISWAERAPLDASTNVELALAHASLGQRLIQSNDLEGARRAVERARALLPRDTAPTGARARVVLASAHYETAIANTDRSRERYAEAIELLQRGLGKEPHDGPQDELQDIASVVTLARAMSSAASAELDRADWARARSHYEPAIRMLRRAASREPDHGGVMLALQRALRGHGHALLESGERESGLASYREALTLAQRLFELDPASRRAAQAWRDQYDDLGDAMYANARFDEAAALYETFRERAQGLVERDPLNARFRHTAALASEKAADAYRNLRNEARRAGEVEESARHAEAAVERYESALASYLSLVQDEPSNAEWQISLGRCGHQLGTPLYWVGRVERAREVYEIASGAFEAADQLEPLDERRQELWSLTLRALGYAHFALGDLEAAERAGRRAIETATPNDPMRGKVYAFVATLCAQRSDFAEARRYTAEGVAFYESLGEDTLEPRQARALKGLRIMASYLQNDELPPDDETEGLF